VNMNGRVYDPIVGRFLSPDPNVQSATDLQSYNRYSYVFNNPLRYTDPTGYFGLGSVGSWISANWQGVAVGLVAIGACAAAGPGCVAVGVVTAAFSASASLAQGATLSQAFSGALIGLVVGNLGGAAGNAVGLSLGIKAGSAASFAFAEVGGAVGGVAGGALQTLATGGNLGKNILLGAAQGAVWGAVGWGITQPTSLTRWDGDVGGSGAAQLEKKETLDSVLKEAGVTGRPVSADEVLRDGELSETFLDKGRNPYDGQNANPSVVTTDYSAAETRAILGKAIAQLYSHSYPVALAQFAVYVSVGDWDFQSLPGASHDTYNVGNTVLNAGEFGNYFAGYVSQARFGLFGVESSMAGGELFNIVQHAGGDPELPTIFDPAHDQFLILSGAAAASRVGGVSLW
jgi:hypothetical protein